MKCYGNSGYQKQAGRKACLKPLKKKPRVSVRFTKTEYFIIRQKSAKAGLKASAYIRQVTLNGEVLSRLNDEERNFVRQLIGMSNNLTSWQNTVTKTGCLKPPVIFEVYRDRLDVLLKQLSHA